MMNVVDIDVPGDLSVQLSLQLSPRLSAVLPVRQ
jgi:hypothetical protein